MNIAVIGTGYVGLTTGSCLAQMGHNVICIDNDQDKLRKLKRNKSPIFEPGLEQLIRENTAAGRLKFDDQIGRAVKDSQVIFICVNTPQKKDGHAELRYVERVAREIAEHLGCEYRVIVDKCTVPVKTAEKVRQTVMRYCTDETCFDVVSNPEFLKEGTAVEDTMKPDRIVIGADTDQARLKMLDVYAPLVEMTGAPVKMVSVRSAELIKHGANTFLAAKISFANLIAHACEEAGADALEVLEAIGLDERIGRHFLSPGIGFGGSCFPKDIAAFGRTLDMLGIDSQFVRAIKQINSEAIDRFLKKIEKELWILDGKVVGVLGLAFKPRTDDIRNSPALKIIEKLVAEGALIRAYDPEAIENAKNAAPEIGYADNAYDVADGAEALIVCTEWDEFKNLDLPRIKSLMRTPIIFDGRNLFNPEQLTQLGFKYFGVGRA